MTVETGFHDNRLPRHLADAVMEGPPRPQTSREHIKRIRLTCIDANTFARLCNCECRCHLNLPFSFPDAEFHCVLKASERLIPELVEPCA